MLLKINWNRAFAADGEKISKIFWTQSLSHHWTYTGDGIYHHCNRILSSCQNTESWERCRLQWNPTGNAQSLKKRWRFLAESCLWSGLVFWKGIRLTSPDTRETGENARTTEAQLSPKPHWKTACQVPKKICTEIIEPKLEDIQCDFRHYWPKYGVDGPLLLAVKLLYSFSEACVRVGRVKSQHVLSPLLFEVYILVSWTGGVCVKGSHRARQWQRHTVEKQDNSKWTVVLFFFMFDCDVSWGASIND